MHLLQSSLYLFKIRSAHHPHRLVTRKSCWEFCMSVEYNDAMRQEQCKTANEMNFLTLTRALLYYR